MKLVTGTATVDDLDRFVAELGEIADGHDATVQAFDARYVACPEHLERALELADRAIERGENVARDRAVEILLYAAGRRQIDQALEMGVAEGETPVVVVVDAANSAKEREAADAVAEHPAIHPGDVEWGDDEQIRGFFEIGEDELEATTKGLEDLVLERVALLDVEK